MVNESPLELLYNLFAAGNACTVSGAACAVYRDRWALRYTSIVILMARLLLEVRGNSLSFTVLFPDAYQAWCLDLGYQEILAALCRCSILHLWTTVPGRLLWLLAFVINRFQSTRETDHALRRCCSLLLRDFYLAKVSCASNCSPLFWLPALVKCLHGPGGFALMQTMMPI